MNNYFNLWETYGLRDNTYTGERSLVKFYTLAAEEDAPPDTDRILQELADPMSQRYPQRWVEIYHHKVIGRLSRSFYDSIPFEKWLRFMARWGGFVPSGDDAPDDPTPKRPSGRSIMTKRELIQVLEAMPCPDETDVLITCEETLNNLEPQDVYLSADGTLLLDGDGSTHRDKFTSGEWSTTH